MAVEQPSEPEVRGLLRDAGLAGQERLNRDQFDGLYLSVLKLAAGKCARSFLAKYGTGIALGTVGVFAAKRALRAVPLVGLVASPFLLLLPTLIVGPVVGEALAGAAGRRLGGQARRWGRIGWAEPGSAAAAPPGVSRWGLG
jgi:hypothetical protein